MLASLLQSRYEACRHQTSSALSIFALLYKLRRNCGALLFILGFQRIDTFGLYPPYFPRNKICHQVINRSNEQRYKYTVLNAWEYATFTASPTAPITVGVMPGTVSMAVTVPAVIAAKRAGRSALGNPAFTAAGATFAGSVVVNRFVRILTYMEAADVFS
jgi:hypothetical protein